MFNPDQKDSDDDEVGDACDNCPRKPNHNQSDVNGDGVGDVCDGKSDSDGDGLVDEEDNCPATPNSNQKDADRDGVGDVCDNCPSVPNSDRKSSSFQADIDDDGLGNECDNCERDFNSDQKDGDRDGEGDICDSCPSNPSQVDRDEDGTDDVCDNCPNLKNINQWDWDDDGVGDACDNCPNIPNPDQRDSDSDGMGDACESTSCTDTTPPTITCPEDLEVPCDGYDGDQAVATVNYTTPTATDDCDPSPAVTCNPASGSRFRQGITTVTCTATDDEGKSAMCTFRVIVSIPPTGCGEGIASPNHAHLASSASSSFPPNTIVLTPTGDVTLFQRSVTTNKGREVQTAGPGLVTLPSLEGEAPHLLGSSVRYDFLRFGLVTGGVKGVQARSGQSDLRTAGPTDLGAVAALSFDLSIVKELLRGLRIAPDKVRATLRVTPIRALAAKDAEPFVTGITPAPRARSSTMVAVLDMPSAPTRTISVADFPGMPDLSNPASSARASLDDLERAITRAPRQRKASVPIGSSGRRPQLSIDVSDAILQALEGESLEASVGFILASELNGTSVVFADSSWAVPGATDILAPHLVLEVLDLPSARGPQLVVSTTRIPFDRLRTGSRDLLLVTISNLGSEAGQMEVYMPARSYALRPAPGAQLNLDGNNRATIPAGGHLTFGVTFQPMEAGPEEAQMLILTTTTPPGKVVGRIALEGAGVPDETGGVPPIVAPIMPPPEFVRVASAAHWVTKVAVLPWLWGPLLLVGLLTVTGARLRRRRRT